jgi:hypothetical protein
MEDIAWRWQSVDGTVVKAPLAQESVGPKPTDRGKNGSKRMLLVDARGVPLSIIVTGDLRPLAGYCGKVDGAGKGFEKLPGSLINA